MASCMATTSMVDWPKVYKVLVLTRHNLMGMDHRYGREMFGLKFVHMYENLVLNTPEKKYFKTSTFTEPLQPVFWFALT